MTRRRRRDPAVDIANAFLLGYALGRDEAYKEARADLRVIGEDFENLSYEMRVEVAKAISQIRRDWGLPEHDPDYSPATRQ